VSEVKRLLTWLFQGSSVTNGQRNYAIVFMLITSGLRPAELILLRWKDREYFEDFWTARFIGKGNRETEQESTPKRLHRSVYTEAEVAGRRYFTRKMAASDSKVSRALRLLEAKEAGQRQHSFLPLMEQHRLAKIQPGRQGGGGRPNCLSGRVGILDLCGSPLHAYRSIRTRRPTSSANSGYRCSMAQRAAWSRLGTLIFLKMWYRCVFTVWGLK
jgi:hypothetical protein